MRAAVATFAAGVLAVASPAVGTMRVAGSDLLGERFTRAVAEFARQNDVEVKLELRGSRPGLDDVKARRADVGLFLLPPGERPSFEALVSKPIAYQVAVVVVPEASPLKQVTVPQLRGMFALAAGETFSRWGELNLDGEWSSRPIVLRALTAKFSGGLAFSLFQNVVLADGEAKAGLLFSSDAPAFNDALNATPNAIGVAGWSGANAPGLRVLAVAVNATEAAVAPTAETVHAGRYGLRMPLVVVFRRESAAELQGFLKFLLSDEASAALAPADFVGLPLGARNDLIFEFEEIR